MAGDDSKEVSKSSNVRGIPEAKFIEDVVAFMAKQTDPIQEVIRKHDELLSKYRFMESHLIAQQKKVKTQIPDITNCLKIVDELEESKKKEETLETRYMLSDQVYCQAEIEPTDKVCLWLGANVMLEYDLPSAKELLESNQEKAQVKLELLLTDLDYLRTQCTTTEVNIARLYNWDVQRRRAEAAKAKA